MVPKLGLDRGRPVVAASCPGRLRRRLRWSAALAAVLLVALLGTALLPDVGSSNCRSGVIAVLEAGKLRVGMAREEVRALLGPPKCPGRATTAGDSAPRSSG